jgi:hypothetical protein
MKPFYFKDHPKPITRRQLLAQGFIASAGAFFGPSLLGRIGAQALADDCSSGTAASKYIPFLVFDCAGGAALPANFLVGGQGGPEDLLPSYNLLGWDPRASNALDRSFGLPMAGGNVSQILAGIQQAASAPARAGLRMGSFCHTAQDDTSTNPLSAVSLVAQSGYQGSSLSSGVGTVSSVSGGNSQAAFANTALQPLYVSSINDLQGAVSFGNHAPFTGIAASLLDKMFGASSDLSSQQLAAYAGDPQTPILTKLAQCGYKQNRALLAGNTALDARQNGIFQNIYNINSGTAPSDPDAVFASLVLSALSGNTGPAVLTIGGCDYHDGTQTTGDAKDREIGMAIGRAVEAAYQLKTPLFFQLLTDGGLSNIPGSRTWVSDLGLHGLTVIGYYNPQGAPAQARTQVGYYTAGQVAETSTLTGLGGSPSKVACAVFANYLRLITQPTDFENQLNAVVPKGTFQDMNEVMAAMIFA